MVFYQKARSRLNKPAKGGKAEAKLRRLTPLKFSSTGYKFPGGPVMYMKEAGGGGQYSDDGFLGEGGGGDGGGISGGGGGGKL